MCGLAAFVGGARGQASRPHPVALSVDFLEDRPVFQTEVAGHAFVVVTSPDGANRVYRIEGERFERRLDDFRVADADGRV